MSEDRTRLSNLHQQFPRVFGKEREDQDIFEHAAGWAQLLTLLAARIDTILSTDPEAAMHIVYIKQELGELRFEYFLMNASQATHDAVDEAVEAACKASTSICERCGQPGTLQKSNSGLIRHRCTDCMVSDRLNH